jgi:hypothetical protein
MLDAEPLVAGAPPSGLHFVGDEEATVLSGDFGGALEVAGQGSSMCVCGSMPPGMTSFPAASITRSASMSNRAPMTETISSSIRMSAL